MIDRTPLQRVRLHTARGHIPPSDAATSADGCRLLDRQGELIARQESVRDWTTAFERSAKRAHGDLLGDGQCREMR